MLERKPLHIRGGTVNISGFLSEGNVPPGFLHRKKKKGGGLDWRRENREKWQTDRCTEKRVRRPPLFPLHLEGTVPISWPRRHKRNCFQSVSLAGPDWRMSYFSYLLPCHHILNSTFLIPRRYLVPNNRLKKKGGDGNPGR